MNEATWHRIWSQRGLWAHMLWPLSMVYRVLLAVRRGLYRWGYLTTNQLPVPVLVVGNVLVGGTGKTPVTLALIEQLGLLGWRIGVVSRGHGRKTSATTLLNSNSTAEQVGDEPLLIQRRTGVPVSVGANRTQAARLLLDKHPELNLIICDDGLQHAALRHDLALCIFDHRQLGNGWLLPAGPLREPWPLIGSGRAPVWVLSSDPNAWPDAWPIHRTLSPLAVNGHGRKTDWKKLNQPVKALAAIGQPDVFFQSLRSAGLVVETALAFPDHDDLKQWHPEPGTDWVCTEKDAVKIWQRHPEVWAIPLELKLPYALIDQLSQFLQARLSSHHGPQTI